MDRRTGMLLAVVLAVSQGALAPVQEPASVRGPADALAVYKADPATPGAAGGNFTGLAKAQPAFDLVGNEVLRSSAVTFQPGGRTKWHSHPHGQLLIVTAGEGWIQSDGAAVQKIVPGDVIWTPPSVRHWHGATRTTAMTHVSASQRDEIRPVQWQEPVSEQQYNGPR